MINKILLILLLSIISVTIYWHIFGTAEKAEVTDGLTRELPVNEPEETAKTKTYLNEEWGFQTEIPTDWKLKENYFRAGSSLFNVVFEPTRNNHLPSPIIINVTPASWGERLFGMYEFTEEDKFVVGNKTAYYATTTDMSIPAYSYLIPINDEYWIDIIGKTDYEETLNLVLETFKIRD